MASATSVKLDDDIKERVRHLAKIGGARHTGSCVRLFRSMSSVKEKREALRLDTLKAWEEFQETRLHATAEEVEEWLESWGTDKELPVPECHK